MGPTEITTHLEFYKTNRWSSFGVVFGLPKAIVSNKRYSMGEQYSLQGITHISSNKSWTFISFTAGVRPINGEVLISRYLRLIESILIWYSYVR